MEKHVLHCRKEIILDYFVSFNGHFIESLRPTGWPAIVQEKMVFRADSPEILAAHMNQRAAQLKHTGGLTVTVDDGVKPDPIFGGSKFVPLHMFAYIDFTVKQLASEMPNPTDEGVQLQ